MKRFRAIRKGLEKGFPFKIKGNMARQLNTLTALVSGIVGSKKSNLPHIAQKVPDKTKPDSREKRFTRFLKNENVTIELFLLPFVNALLEQLCHAPIFLIIDGSIVGRNCICLMVSIYYRKRAIPIAWHVVRRKKGVPPKN